MRFIKASLIRKYVKEKGKRVGRDFLYALDAHVQRRLDAALNVHNGGKITLDAAVAGVAGINTSQNR